jgi:hypothetical protein
MKRTRLGLFLVVGLLALMLTAPGPAPQVQAQGTQLVGLVVKFDNGSVFTGCIDYTGSGMTGEEVLDQSGLSLVKDFSYGYALGAAICKIEDDGCNYPDQHCFCQCTGGGDCEYWAYFHLDEQKGEWIYSGMGASWHTVQPGDVEGWAWGAGSSEDSEVEPPLITFEELCVPPTPTPTPSPPVVDFTADPEHVIAGQCSTLRWSVDNGEIVILDGEGVRPDDARYLCPSESHTYELEVLNAAGEYYYEVTIQVAQPTATPLPTATPTTVRSATSRPTSAPPPAATATAQQPVPSPSPSPTESATATSTSTAVVVAEAPTATAFVAEEQSPGVTETPAALSPETVNSPTPPETTPYEAVGLDRILLLVGVGAGTLGFGTLVFVGMVALLVLIYLRARAHF